MKPVRYRSVNDVQETLQVARSRKRGCTLLIGAGCSVTAGIPTATGFVEIIRNEHKQAYARAAEKTYARCMAELLLAERRDLIARYVDKAQINWAHLCIALLIKAGYVDRVLTTNFDLLVVRACALLGVFPAVYDFATSQLLKRADIPDQAIFYLHGQRTGFVLMNTDNDMNRHAKLLGPVIDDAGSGRVWIVAGYSGETDPVFNHLVDISRFDNGLFWVGYRDSEPQMHVREHLVGEDKDAFYVKGHDADSFFVALCRELGIFPPDLVARPFTYLERALTGIAPFVEPGHDTVVDEDVLRMPRAWIRNAITQFESPAWEIITHGEVPHVEGQDRALLHAAAARYLLMAGRHDAVIALRKEYEASPSPEFANVLSMAYVMRGNVLLDCAKSATDPEDVERLFSEARQMYDEALVVKADRSEAWHNIGNVLLDRAKRASASEAEPLFRAAVDQYERALAIDPQRHEVLVNWGNLLLERAKHSADAATATQFFEDAESKYRAALAIQPDMPAVLVNWGNLLLDRAKTVAGPDAISLFAEAQTKYKAALERRPNMHDAYSQWGNLLLEMGKRTPQTEPESERLFAESAAKFSAALAIKPDMYEALNNWGNLLLDRAKRRIGSQADELFAESVRKYEEALSIRPHARDVLYNQANALTDWSRIKEGDEAQRLFARAEEAYRAARDSGTQ